MNAVARAGYVPPYDDGDLLSSERALRPDFAMRTTALLGSAFSAEYENVGGVANPTTYLLNPESLSASRGAFVIFDQMKSQLVGPNVFGQPDFISGNISWTSQWWNATHQFSASFWKWVQLQTLLTKFRRSGVTPFTERLALRIEYLYKESLEDDELPLSIDSVIQFLSFLELVRPGTYPDVTLTSSGCIFVTWGRVTGQKISLEFADRRIKYTFFYKSQLGDTLIARGYGDLPLNEILMFISQLPSALSSTLFADAR